MHGEYPHILLFLPIRPQEVGDDEIPQKFIGPERPLAIILGRWIRLILQRQQYSLHYHQGLLRVRGDGADWVGYGEPYQLPPEEDRCPAR